MQISSGYVGGLGRLADTIMQFSDQRECGLGSRPAHMPGTNAPPSALSWLKLVFHGGDVAHEPEGNTVMAISKSNNSGFLYFVVGGLVVAFGAFALYFFGVLGGQDEADIKIELPSIQAD